MHGVGVEIAGQFGTAGEQRRTHPQRGGVRQAAARSPQRLAAAAPAVTASAAVEAAQPTAPCTSSRSFGCDTTRRPRAYVDRRTAEGLSKREIIQCLKRYIAREVFNNLPRAMLAQPSTTSWTPPLTNIGASNASADLKKWLTNQPAQPTADELRACSTSSATSTTTSDRTAH